MISFNQIPINLRVPGAYVEFDNSAAVQGLVAMPQKILVVGQKLDGSAAVADVPLRIFSHSQAVQQFGRGSMLATMFEFLKKANAFVEAWALPLADPAAGTASTRTLQITAPATSAGTLVLYVGGRRIEVGVAATQTAAQVASAIATAVNADLDALLTAAAAVDTVTFTARHKGIAAGEIDVRLNYYAGEATPPGMALTLSALTAGTGVPSLAAGIAALGDTWFTRWAQPYTDAATLTVVEDDLDSRWGPTRMIEGIAFAAATGSLGQLTALGESRNSQLISIMDASGSPTPAFVWAASITGIVAGEPDPARPLQTLRLPGILPAAISARHTATERNQLLFSGISTHAVDAGGDVTIERLITTYRVNAANLPDPSYLDIETITTLAYLRFSVRVRITQKYPRHKLASDGTFIAPGQAIVTPSVVRAELISLFRDWETAGLVEGFEQFKRDLLVERNTTDVNRLDAQIPPDIINQLRVFAGQIQFRL